MLSSSYFERINDDDDDDDIAALHYAVLNVPRQLCSGGPSRGGGLAVLFRHNLVVKFIFHGLQIKSNYSIIGFGSVSVLVLILRGSIIWL